MAIKGIPVYLYGMETMTVIVTGATRGLGRLVAEGAALRGARVVLACRDPLRGAEARDAIAAKAAAAAATGGATAPPPELLVLDLASLASVRRAAEEARARFPRIDVLVNNAGTFSRHYSESKDGFELSMATNYLGPFLFTRLLLPAMTPAGRIVNLSSDAYPWGKASLGKPARGGVWSGFMNYAASKRAILQFTLALAAREARRGPEGLRVNALHPGVVRTEIMRMRTWYGFIVDLILAPFFQPPDEGVGMILALALSEAFADASGGYYRKGRREAPRKAVAEAGRLEELWEESSRLVGLEP
jgi:NAD(P)-dependent dehydrogenase (short-subunit alcohol dehydrogenase family)